MKILRAIEAKYGFGRPIDVALARPVLVSKHGRRVLVVMAIEGRKRLRVGEGNGKDKQSTGIRLARPKDIDEK